MVHFAADKLPSNGNDTDTKEVLVPVPTTAVKGDITKYPVSYAVFT